MVPQKVIIIFLALSILGWLGSKLNQIFFKRFIEESPHTLDTLRRHLIIFNAAHLIFMMSAIIFGTLALSTLILNALL